MPGTSEASASTQSRTFGWSRFPASLALADRGQPRYVRKVRNRPTERNAGR
jgi:hypothetical protein